MVNRMKSTALPLLLLLLSTVYPFTLHQQPVRVRSTIQRAALADCFAANEFSRLLDPERVLKIGSASTSSSANRNRREYHMNVEASAGECQALAQRFELPALDRLAADAVLRPAARTVGVEVEGSIYATLTQRCVRTNEDFSMNVEFPLQAIVRPVVPLNVNTGRDYDKNNDNNDDDDVSDVDSDWDRAASTSRPKKPPNLESLDVFQLQQLLQDDDEDEELADVLMEDQAIYPVGGQMDLGELVAQLFWLQLDPYPKKPGSEPIRRSISG